MKLILLPLIPHSKKWTGDKCPLPALPTLGGNNSFATAANNAGQMVGWAENTVHDTTCTGGQILQFRAVIWGPNPGQIQELPPLPGDLDSAATAINDQGQVVGISGACGVAVGGVSAAHAVLWENGKVIKLADLGGMTFNTPMAINNRGEIAGFALPASQNGTLNFHAVIWPKEGGIQDLNTLPGDTISEVTGLNDEDCGRCLPSRKRGVRYHAGGAYVSGDLEARRLGRKQRSAERRAAGKSPRDDSPAARPRSLK